GGTAAGMMGEALGWRSSFYLFGMLGAALGLVLVFLLREPPREPVRARMPAAASVARILRTPMVLILMAVFVGANFVAAIVLTWMPSFLSRKFGMSLGAAGFSSTAYLQAASVVGVI